MQNCNFEVFADILTKLRLRRTSLKTLLPTEPLTGMSDVISSILLPDSSSMSALLNGLHGYWTQRPLLTHLQIRTVNHLIIPFGSPFVNVPNHSPIELLPFGVITAHASRRYACDVGIKVIQPSIVKNRTPVKRGVIGSSKTSTAPYSPSLITNQSASISTWTKGVQIRRHTTVTTSLIAAPYALIHPMVQTDVLVIEAHAVVTPYIALAWKEMLSRCDLTVKYPNLVHDIIYGSPIGNPPYLSNTFIPPNMRSANEHPQLIDEYLIEETNAGRMSRGLTVDQAIVFFGGHFRTAPIGVVEQDGKFRVIHNLSAIDPDGYSTNSWLDSSENATKFYSAAQFAEAVSLNFTFFEPGFPPSLTGPGFPLSSVIHS